MALIAKVAAALSLRSWQRCGRTQQRAASPDPVPHPLPSAFQQEANGENGEFVEHVHRRGEHQERERVT